MSGSTFSEIGRFKLSDGSAGRLSHHVAILRQGDEFRRLLGRRVLVRTMGERSGSNRLLDRAHAVELMI
jgi:hypothetical protein